MEQTERSETSEHKIQTPGNHPKERIQHSEHGEIFKSNDMSVIQSHRIFQNKDVILFIREKFSLNLQWEELANKRFCSCGTGINKLLSGHSTSELLAIYFFWQGRNWIWRRLGGGGSFSWNSRKENSICTGFLGIFRLSPSLTLISAILTSYLEGRSKLKMSEKKMVTKLWRRKYRQVNRQLAGPGDRAA